MIKTVSDFQPTVHCRSHCLLLTTAVSTQKQARGVRVSASGSSRGLCEARQATNPLAMLLRVLSAGVRCSTQIRRALYDLLWRSDLVDMIRGEI